MNASKEKFGADALDDLFAGASRVVVAKGKKVLDFDLKKDPPDPAELEKVALGPTGNLRAPAARVGKTWLIGFHAEAYADLFG